MKDIEFFSEADSPSLSQMASVLSDALNSDDQEEFFAALHKIIRINGVASVARRMGAPREVLYKAFRQGKNEKYYILFKVMMGLGLQFSVRSRD
jgi:probable addiction module antidote protein